MQRPVAALFSRRLDAAFVEDDPKRRCQVTALQKMNETFRRLSRRKQHWRARESAARLPRSCPWRFRCACDFHAPRAQRLKTADALPAVSTYIPDETDNRETTDA